MRALAFIALLLVMGCTCPQEKCSKEGTYRLTVSGLDEKADGSMFASRLARVQGVKATKVVPETGLALVEIEPSMAVSLAELERALAPCKLSEAAPLEGTLRLTVEGPAADGSAAAANKLKQFKGVSLVTFVYDDEKKPHRIEACEVSLAGREDVSPRALREAFAAESRVSLRDIALLGPQPPRRPRPLAER